MSIINNTIFRENQEYMFVLQTSCTLERYLKEKDISDAQREDLKRIQADAIAGLLRGGLECVSVDNETIQLTIDKLSYFCPKTLLADVLKDDYKEIVHEDPPMERTKNELQKETFDVHMPPDLLIANNNTEAESILQKTISLQETSPQPSDPPNAEKTPDIVAESTNELTKASYGQEVQSFLSKGKLEQDEGEKKEEILPTEINKDIDAELREAPKFHIEKTSSNNIKETIVREKEYQNSYYENQKGLNTFCYKQYKLAIDDTIIPIYIVPTKIMENEPQSEFIIFVNAPYSKSYILSKNGFATFVYKSFSCSFTGSFIEGEFNVFCLYNNPSDENLLKIKNESSKNSLKAQYNFGTLCFKKNDLEVHVFPLDNKNDSTGNAIVAAFIINDDNKIYGFPYIDAKHNSLEVNGFEFMLVSYIDNNILYSDFC